MRSEFSELGKSEDEIMLNKLKAEHTDTSKGDKLWFHATSWDKAQGIIQSGPRFYPTASDFSKDGAFYLNDNYIDCYDFLKRRKFAGNHAMLIYQFEPDTLEKRGTNLDVFDEWRSHVFDCLTGKRNSKGKHWYYGAQCSRPGAVKHKSEVTRRMLNDTKYAMQLAIVHVEMCAKVHDCLIGCVFYQNLNCSDPSNQNESSPTSGDASGRNLDNTQLLEAQPNRANLLPPCQQDRMESDRDSENNASGTQRAEKQPLLDNKASYQTKSCHNTDKLSSDDKEEQDSSSQNPENDSSDIPKNENRNLNIKEEQTTSMSKKDCKRSGKRSNRK
ncbi:unnamed protein product [Didymodactylos carnosus]|uniref:Uncharacterized protein n=1 Tax=Didymodactylos carnosus TaxID=1234261 RepID=A0A814UGP9_9BILA|nr:unnamed protein product [Didymodactylos carnosus]CAF3938066.1 unnamed protein product [Didymodactylos carnosus]